MHRKRSFGMIHLCVIVLALLLMAAPIAVACVTCGGGAPALLDGEFYGGG